MRRLGFESPVQDLVGCYGPDSLCVGVLSDHAHLAPQGALRHLRSGRPVVVDMTQGGLVYNVVCSEIIAIRTEDGPSDGRCGGRVERADAHCCPGHQDYYDRQAGVSLEDRLAREFDREQQDRAVGCGR